MRYIDVRFGRDRITSFISTWPCSGLHELGRVIFTFDSSGDLVDMTCWDLGGQEAESARFDGPALLAMSQDAWKERR